jgi:uncharacterized protein
MKQFLQSLVLLAILPLLAWADNTELYQIDIPVASQSTAVREQALAVALKEVLIKASGDKTVTQHAKFQAVLTQVNDFLEEYRYWQMDSQSQADGTQPGQLMLQVRFQAQAITHVLQELGFAAWNKKQRPMMLVWLLVQDAEHGIELFGNDDPSPLLVQLKRVMAARALPIVLPIMDLNMLNTPFAQAIWDVDMTQLKQVAENYAVQSQVIIRIKQRAADDWSADATLLTAADRLDLLANHGSMDEVINAMADEISANLAQTASSKSNAKISATEIQLTVQAIKDVADSVALLRYLRKISGISEVQIIHMKGDTLGVSLTMQGDLATLQRVLNEEQVLVPVESADSLSALATDALVYQWNQ